MVGAQGPMVERSRTARAQHDPPKMSVEARQATQNMRCQGCRAECSTLKPSSSLVPVEACQDKAAICRGVKVLSPGIFVIR